MHRSCAVIIFCKQTHGRAEPNGNRSNRERDGTKTEGKIKKQKTQQKDTRYNSFLPKNIEKEESLKLRKRTRDTAQFILIRHRPSFSWRVRKKLRGLGAGEGEGRGKRKYRFLSPSYNPTVPNLEELATKVSAFQQRIFCTTPNVQSWGAGVAGSSPRVWQEVVPNCHCAAWEDSTEREL